MHTLKNAWEAAVCNQQVAVTSISDSSIAIPGIFGLGIWPHPNDTALWEPPSWKGVHAVQWKKLLSPSSQSRTVGLPWEEVAHPSLGKLPGGQGFLELHSGAQLLEKLRGS